MSTRAHRVPGNLTSHEKGGDNVKVINRSRQKEVEQWLANKQAKRHERYLRRQAKRNQTPEYPDTVMGQAFRKAKEMR